MEIIMNKNLLEFNRLDNLLDQVYNSYLSSNGISMTTMWILYFTYMSNGTSTQKDICENWFYVSQTINSALKVLEKNGVVELYFAEGNRKSKQIRLTDKGVKQCIELVEPIIRAENNAFSVLTEAEQELLVSISKKYIDALQKEISLLETKRSK